MYSMPHEHLVDALTDVWKIIRFDTVLDRHGQCRERHQEVFLIFGITQKRGKLTLQFIEDAVEFATVFGHSDTPKAGQG